MFSSVLFAFPLFHEVAEIADDGAGPDGLVGGFFHRVAGVLDLRGDGLSALEETLRRLDVIGHRGERLVEFMGDGRAHLAHGAQAAHMGQFGLQRRGPPLAAPRWVAVNMAYRRWCASVTALREPRRHEGERWY